MSRIKIQNRRRSVLVLVVWSEKKCHLPFSTREWLAILTTLTKYFKMNLNLTDREKLTKVRVEEILVMMISRVWRQSAQQEWIGSLLAYYCQWNWRIFRNLTDSTQFLRPANKSNLFKSAWDVHDSQVFNAKWTFMDTNAKFWHIFKD